MAWLTATLYKQWAGISGTEQDTQITQAAAAAQQEIEKYCQRQFELQTHIEYQRLANCQYRILLRNYPIDTIFEIAKDTSPAFRFKIEEGYNSVGCKIGSDSMVLYLQSTEGNNTETLSFMSHPTLQNLAETLSQPPYNASVEWVNTDLADISSQRLKESLLVADVMTDYFTVSVYNPIQPGELTLDVDNGIIKFWRRLSPGTVRIRYSAGYSSIPSELLQIGYDLIKMYLDKQSLNTLVQSERIGDYSYTNREGGSTAYEILPKDIQGRLNKWKRWIV